MTDGENSIDMVCVFAKKNYMLFASVGRNDAVSIPAITVLRIGAEPKLIHKRRIEPARHSYIRSVQSPRLPNVFKRVMKSHGLMTSPSVSEKFEREYHFSWYKTSL